MPSPPGDRIAALDGVRALAVVLVLAYHADLSFVGGGFAGVDVFFVLSGFLITRNLLEEGFGGERISLARFYARRSARLLPAAIVMALTAAVVFSVLSTPVERSSVLGDLRASLLYVANWHFLADSTDYFQSAVGSSPYLHMWSLSVEEQFYIVWPLVVALLVRFSRRRANAGRTCVTALLAASAAGTAWTVYCMATRSTSRVYYGTDTRAYQLLLGGTLAALFLWTNRSIPRRTAPYVGAIALAAIVGVAVVGDVEPTTRGLLVTLPTLALIGAITTTDRTLLHSVMGCRPLVFIGGLSYGIYLWHWPIIVALDRTFVLGSRAKFVVVVVASVVVAHFSRVLLERPVIAAARRLRSRDAQRRAVLLGLGCSVVAALVVAPLCLSEDIPPVRAAARPEFAPSAPAPALVTATPVPANLGMVAPQPYSVGGACIGLVPQEGNRCTVIEGTGPTVLLIGDSHAIDLIPGLGLMAASQGFSFHAIGMDGCPWQFDLAYDDFDTDGCAELQQVIRDRVLTDLAPDVIILSGHPYTDAEFAVHRRGEPSGVGSAEMADVIAATTQETLTSMTAAAGRVVTIEPRPSAPFHVPSCLSAALTLEHCAFVASTDTLEEGIRLREVAQTIPNVTSVSTDDLVCPRYPICDPLVKDVLVRFDRDHLYDAFAQQIAPELWTRMGLG